MKTQNEYSDLPKLSIYRYENFFNIYEESNKTKFYNLLKSINIIPANDSSAESEYYTKPNDTWVYISYQFYKTTDLWWLICEYNQIKDPTKMPNVGTKIKILNKELVWPIISELISQIRA